MTPKIDVDTDKAEQDEHCADHVAKHEIPALPEPLPLTRRRPFSKINERSADRRHGENQHYKID